MIEITRQITGMAKKIDTVEDAIEVIEWAQGQPGIAFTLAARADGALHMQAEGVSVETVYPTLGQWLVFDGARFLALSDGDYVAAGYTVV
ncbi:hypothetical protein [Mycolicibacterium sp.]|uniref:hypothetical protein n=1 Tax=Mycolicibacterium sp. TaxID=2320850 RepID=UPI0037C73EC7